MIEVEELALPATTVWVDEAMGASRPTSGSCISASASRRVKGRARPPAPGGPNSRRPGRRTRRSDPIASTESVTQTAATKERAEALSQIAAKPMAAADVSPIRIKDAVYVGDRLIPDVGGAQGVGMKAVLIEVAHRLETHPDIEPDARVKDLPELLGVLPALF